MSVDVSNDIIIPGLAGQLLCIQLKTIHFVFMQPCYFKPFLSSMCYVNLAFINFFDKRGMSYYPRGILWPQKPVLVLYTSHVVQHGGHVSSM